MAAVAPVAAAAVPNLSSDSQPKIDTKKRPLAAPFDPKSVGPGTFLPNNTYTTKTPVICEDGETDDLTAITLDPRKKVVVAEHHRKIEDTHGASQRILDVVSGHFPNLIKGSDENHQTENAMLTGLYCNLLSSPDKSRTLLLLSPADTIAAFLKANDNPAITAGTLARKIDRIVWLGGFSEDNGQQYTTHNLSENTEAAQAVFDFAEKYKVPLYILSMKHLRTGRCLKFDIPRCLEQSGTTAAKKLCENIQQWNLNLKPDKKSDLIRYAQEAGYVDADEDFIMRMSMPEADLLALVFDAAFESLQIDSQRIGNIKITDESRPKAPKDKKVTFDLKDDSSIHYVKGFSLNGEDTTTTAEIILRDLIARHAYSQQTNGADTLSVAATPASVENGALGNRNEPAAAEEPGFRPQAAAPAAPKSVEFPSKMPYASLMNVDENGNPTTKDAFLKRVKKEDVFIKSDIEDYVTQILNGDLSKYFDLYKALRKVKLYEFFTNEVDGVRRSAFLHAFEDVRAYLNKKLDLIESSELTQDQKKELHLFATEGRGPNSLEVFTNALVPFSPLDDKYGARIMAWADGKLQLRPNDKIPQGLPNAGQLLGSVTNKDKVEIKLQGPQFTQERVEDRAFIFEEAKGKNQTISDRMKELYDSWAITFVRGPLAVGKTEYLGRILGIREEEIPNVDTLTKLLDTKLSHNEAAKMNDQLVDWTLINCKHCLFVKTYTKVRDTEILCNTKDRRLRIIHDIAASYKTISEHLEKRIQSGGRDPGVRSLLESFQESQINRPKIIEAASKDPLICWRLINNNRDLSSHVASISGKKLEIHDWQGLVDLCKTEPTLKAALQRVYKVKFEFPV